MSEYGRSAKPRNAPEGTLALLPNLTQLAQHMARNRQRLLALFAEVDDITWGRHVGQDRAWSIQDLLAHLTAGEERTARYLGLPLPTVTPAAPERGDEAVRRMLEQTQSPTHWEPSLEHPAALLAAPFRPTAQRSAEQAEVDDRRLVPVPIMLERYATLSAQHVEAVPAALTFELPIGPDPARLDTVGAPTRGALQGRRPLGRARDDGTTDHGGGAQVLAALWLDHMLHEADLRRELAQPALAAIVSPAEARDLAATAIGLLPPLLRAHRPGAFRGTVLFGLAGTGHGIWTLEFGPDTASAWAGGRRVADLRLDSTFAAAIEMLTGALSPWRALASGALRIAAPHPWRALRLIKRITEAQNAGKRG